MTRRPADCPVCYAPLMPTRDGACAVCRSNEWFAMFRKAAEDKRKASMAVKRKVGRAQEAAHAALETKDGPKRERARKMRSKGRKISEIARTLAVSWRRAKRLADGP